MIELTASFEAGGIDTFNPEYAGVDWRKLLLARFVLEREQIPVPVFLVTNDGLNLQITQENTEVYVNSANDSLDCVIVDDPRDDSIFTFWRDDHAEFDEILRMVSHHAVAHISPYPAKEIAEMFAREKSRDVENADSVPDEWETP